MRKLILISLVFALLFSHAAFAGVSLTVSWQSAVDTLMPGTDTKISLTITNSGTSDLTNVVVTPSGGPYVTPTSGVIELSGLAASSSQQASISLKVDKNAPTTNSYVYLDIDYYTGTTAYKKTMTIPVSIKREPILQIVNVNYSDVVSPGKMITLSFDIKNAGVGPAQNLIVSLEESDLFIVSQSAGEAVIDTLDAGESKNLKFVIIVDPGADVGIGTIPIKLKYYDETKQNSYSDTKNIGLAITGQVDFVVTVTEASGDTATIKITNRGNAPAEYLDVKASAGNIKKEYYIGTLDSDSSETIEFKQPSTISKYDLELELDYKDKFDNEFSEKKTVAVYPSPEIGLGIIIIIVIVILAGYWFFKKRKFPLLDRLRMLKK